MSIDRVRIDGPHPIYIKATPAGAEIDISAPLETFVLALIREHSEELQELAELDDSASTQLARGNDDSYAGHERDARIQALVEAVGGAIVVHGEKVRETADALGDIARPKAVPGQRGVA